MSWIVGGIIIAVALFLSGFFSGAETGMYRVNRLRLRLAVRKRDARAQLLARVLEDEQGALAVMLIGTNVMNYLTTAVVAFLFAERLGFGASDAEVYTVIIVTPAIFVFGEVVPKNLFRLHADTLLIRGARLLSMFNRLFRLTGIVWTLTRLASLINRTVGSDARPEGAFAAKRQVATLLQEALAGQTHGEERSDMIDRVFRLSETPLHAVMVPRNRVTAIAASTNPKTLAKIARRTEYERLPVYEAGGRHISGLVEIDDLLQSSDWTTVQERLSPIAKLRPHDTVATAISLLRGQGRSMAVVTGHAGGMLGVVTLNDLLGEAVGATPSGV